MKTILIWVLCAAAAIGQTAAPPADKAIAAAKAKLDREVKRKAAAEKRAADADAAYRKLQGRLELTDAEKLEITRLFEAWQAPMLELNVTLPQQFEQRRRQLSDEIARADRAYQAKLAELKAAKNATNCAGLNSSQQWADCKAAEGDKK